jgi:hypothetical protein
MMGGERPWFARARAAIDHPFVGPLLYRLNVSRLVVSKMARGHVYGDPNWLSADRLGTKLAVTRTDGARHGSVRFVTGALDRVDSREAFLELARQANIPILLIYRGDTPAKSRAEMEALGSLPNVRVSQLTTGKLAIHEELADAMADTTIAFLGEGLSTRK